jgi:hypothetical protein
MRLPAEDDLTIQKFRDPQDNSNPIQDHIDTLADRLKEAYQITRENNRLGRNRQKEQYDKGTRLTIFQPGDIVYIREMVRRKRECPKFRVKWKGPFTVIRRLSDLNYLVKVRRNKEIVVNVNKMKHGYTKTPSHPNVIVDNLSDGVSEPEEMDQERITSPHPYLHPSYDNESVVNPPVETNDGHEDQIQDPTWKPGAQLETQDNQDRVAGRHEYWLRDRPTNRQTVSSDDTPEVALETNDSESAEVDPPTNQPVETGQDETRNESNQIRRYNFRPLPGKKLSDC